ncbi:unnamed protein product [Moneuplotes crassus]|uniref:C2H2-type domain-containing protein n=1 Tax=Euplotes crassus TaxID=5936 RepID=A0AAD1XFE3_EUPCR|nr:unnamed protein product [Moneuplotes crassus]
MIFQRTTSKTTFTNAASLATSVNSQEEVNQSFNLRLPALNQTFADPLMLQSLMQSYCICGPELCHQDFLSLKCGSISLPSKSFIHPSPCDFSWNGNKRDYKAFIQQEFKAEGNDVDTTLQNHQPSYHKRTCKKLLPFEVQDTNQKHSSGPLRPRGKYYCTLDNCGKSFGTMTARDCHARLHSKFRPFKCHLCSKSYTQNMNLKKHLLKHSHPDLDVRRVFECRYCDKKFTEKYTRKTHERKFHSEAL